MPSTPKADPLQTSSPGLMAALHVLRVFTNEDGEWGNHLGVFLEPVPEAERQRIAADLGFSETVFVEDREQARIRIHTPAVELPFAGHPSVGTAWLLAETGDAPRALQTPAGEIGIRFVDDLTWISARPEWSPEFEYLEMPSPAAVRELTGAPDGHGDVYAWAWIDEAAGTVRARSFAPGAGIAEDEATGSAALALSARLGRSLTVHQGRGSVLLARPLGEGRAEVGGGVALDETREYAV
ncbi:MAG TPA: PhzF family phenazine biosynthesis protein [Solirubrobacterales bacterium]